jgi:hypothetical protein
MPEQSASIKPLKCFKCGGLIVGKDADAGYHLSHNEKPKYRTQGDVWEWEAQFAR